jgi:predicted HicB family RNase H-like nuclease
VLVTPQGHFYFTHYAEKHKGYSAFSALCGLIGVLAGSRRTDIKRARYNLNLDPEVYHQAQIQAAIEKRSISEYVEIALQEKLETKKGSLPQEP